MKRRRLTWGIVLLIVGIVLLLDNLNVFDFLGISIWNLIWPLILIGFGVWILWVSRVGPGTGETQEISVPVEGAEQYTVKINYGAGELAIDSQVDAEHLLHCISEGGLYYDVNDGLNEKRIKLWSPVSVQPFRFVVRRKWVMALNGSLPCHLTLKTGACETRADLSDTLVQSLKIETGASSTKIVLPAKAEFTEVRGSGGATSLSLIVPPEVAAHIVVRGGIYSANINQTRFPRQGSFYESPDYENAVNKVDINVDIGLGSVDIQ